MKLGAVVLAAGQGTRMKSNLPKVLHPVAGKAMIHYALDAARALGSDKTVLVIGHGAAQVRDAVANFQLPTSNFQPPIFVEQREQRGTGHAVLQARDVLRNQVETVLVTCGDMPLLQTATLRELADLHTYTGATITMLTVRSDDSMAFGRILRDADGRVLGIVEEGNATPEQLAIRELNCGVYCFDAKWMWEHLTHLKPQGRKKEYYLTDLVGMAVAENCRVEAITLDDVAEVIGINTRAHLANAERIMRERINLRLMDAGVTLVDPATTYVDADVVIGMDTVVEPGCHLKGKTRIGANCRIGPNAMIGDSQIAGDCEIIASVVRDATLEDHVHVGPFADVRPGAYLGRNVYIGNHAEVKNSRLGEDVHVGHFSYIGDSDVGARTNVGAGTITCNFDGKQKHRTVIGEDVFIGSDTLFRAPVTVGARARTGAGSVVTKNVPADSLAVGAPARVIKKLE